MSNILINALLSKVLFTDKEIETIVSRFHPRAIRKHQLLITEGEPARWLAFIESGLMRSYITDLQGREHILNFYSDGHWVTDMDGFHKQIPATLNVEAVRDSLLLLIDQSSFNALFGEAPAFERFWRITYENAYNALQQRYISILSKSAEELYTDLQRNRPELIENLTQRQIASYLGITPESLSRIRAKLLPKHS